MDLGPNAIQRSIHAIRIISIKKLVQGVYRKRYYPVGYNDGHIVVAIWDQVSWLLCSTEAHIWKNPASHFAPLPVPTQMKYRFFFYSFTLSILFTLLYKEEQKFLIKTRISLGQNGITKHIFYILQSIWQSHISGHI